MTTPVPDLPAAPAVKISERDAVLREREAFMSGWHHYLTTRPMDDGDRKSYEREAKRRYPLPKVTRPRVVLDAEIGACVHWRVVGGAVEINAGLRGWCPYPRSTGSPDYAPTLLRVAMWADLLGHPTEEVEDDS